MKKFFLIALMSIAVSLTSNANELETSSKDPALRAQEIENRVMEIWRMDFSGMEKEEKIMLRNELKTMKKEIKRTEGLDNKVSISVGAIIIILLIIIIIT